MPSIRLAAWCIPIQAALPSAGISTHPTSVQIIFRPMRSMSWSHSMTQPLAMGPTELARGSHRLTNHLQNPTLVSDELVYQHPTTLPEQLVAKTEKGKPEGFSSALTTGSCLIFDDRILHRGLGNASDSRRSMAYFSYRQAGYSENTHFEAQRSVYDA
jgi:hypothetical protein